MQGQNNRKYKRKIVYNTFKAPVTYHSQAHTASKNQLFCPCLCDRLCTKVGKTAVFYSTHGS